MAITPTVTHPPVQAHRRRPWLGRSLAVVLMAAGTLTTVGAPPAAAEVTTVTGSAFGFYTDVGLFGGPSNRRGFEQEICTTPGTPPGCVDPGTAPSSESPSVALPATGGDLSDADADGAKTVYGPATIFGGRWPENVASAPPSGPISVASVGTTGADGSVTSTADIVLYDAPVPVRCNGDAAGTTNCTVPGGIGPAPIEADEAHSECTADEAGVTGSATFVEGVLSTSTDAEGAPLDSEPIPDSPENNYTRTGVIPHVGDSFPVIFTEQIENTDGSLTVNAVHLILEGPTAVGDQVIGSVTCGVNATDAPPGGGGGGDGDNGAPVAVDDPEPGENEAYSAQPDTPLTVSANMGVLRNDTDPDGDTLTAGSASTPENGSVTLESDGGFTYTPDDGFTGRDTFTYVVSDGKSAGTKATANGTVKIDVGTVAGGGGGGGVEDDDGMTLELNASPATRPAPGGAFTFDVLITNTSDTALNVTKLTDDVYGDLNGQGTCTVPQNLLAGPATGNTYSCSYTGEFSGDPGDTRTTKVTGTAGALSASDDATLSISGTPAGTASPSGSNNTNNESARGAALARTGGAFTRQVQLAVGLTGLGMAMVIAGQRRRRHLGPPRPTQLTRMW
ncbi:hypothetical protein BH20ACT2_BH20ACT2_25000 [soil metagenome]